MWTKSTAGARFRKVTVAEQTTYTYHTATGDIVIHPDEANGITIDIIRDLHRADNREVEQNLRQAHKPTTEAEEHDIEEWRADPDHPERGACDFPDRYERWNLPIDGCWQDDGSNALDCDPVMAAAWSGAHPEISPRVERLREFIGTLSERQQQLYQLVYIEGNTIREAAILMGISAQRASELDGQIRKNIMNRLYV